VKYTVVQELTCIGLIEVGNSNYPSSWRCWHPLAIYKQDECDGLAL